MAGKSQSKFTQTGLILATAIAAVLLGFQLFGSDSTEPQTTDAPTEMVDDVDKVSSVTISEDGTTVSYSGEEGKSALDLLKELTEATTEDSDFGEFVTGINGVDGGGTQFWLFYVNDEAATVGAADYQTMTGDTIEWRLE